MRFLKTLALFGLLACAAADAGAQGFETGLDVTYGLGSTIDFAGDSSIKLDGDFGLAASFSRRLNPHLEAGVTLDWANVDYRARLQSSTLPALQTSVRGSMESFTLLGRVNWNLIDGDFTPFITGGAGWSFIDTNIPNGNVEIGCWWDPWYGQICTPYQSTRTVDGFTYVLGAGIRWDYSSTSAFKLAYERQFLDLDNARGSPGVDVVKAGWVFKY